MAELKTKQTDADVSEFIRTFADTEQKRVTITQDDNGKQKRIITGTT